MSRRLAEGLEPGEAFRETVARLVGSIAIGATTPSPPTGCTWPCGGVVRRSTSGVAEDAFIVASEPYGLVEETDTYLRMDGETPSDPANPTGSRGQIIELRGRSGR